MKFFEARREKSKHARRSTSGGRQRANVLYKNKARSRARSCVSRGNCLGWESRNRCPGSDIVNRRRYRRRTAKNKASECLLVATGSPRRASSNRRAIRPPNGRGSSILTQRSIHLVAVRLIRRILQVPPKMFHARPLNTRVTYFRRSLGASPGAEEEIRDADGVGVDGGARRKVLTDKWSPPRPRAKLMKEYT